MKASIECLIPPLPNHQGDEITIKLTYEEARDLADRFFNQADATQYELTALVELIEKAVILIHKSSGCEPSCSIIEKS